MASRLPDNYVDRLLDADRFLEDVKQESLRVFGVESGETRQITIQVVDSEPALEANTVFVIVAVSLED